MALEPTAPVPPVHELPLESDGQFSRPWVRFFQRVSNALTAMGSTAAGGLGSLGIAGAVDGSDAASGDIGEYLEATTGSVALVDSVTLDAVTLSLSPGDWDLNGWVNVFLDGGTSMALMGWGVGALDTYLPGLTSSPGISLGGWTGPKRVNATAAGAVQLKVLCSFTGTASVVGLLRARRMR